jgi:hypothetical protein
VRRFPGEACGRVPDAQPRQLFGRPQQRTSQGHHAAARPPRDTQRVLKKRCTHTLNPTGKRGPRSAVSSHKPPRGRHVCHPSPPPPHAGSPFWLYTSTHSRDTDTKLSRRSAARTRALEALESWYTPTTAPASPSPNRTGRRASALPPGCDAVVPCKDGRAPRTTGPTYAQNRGVAG